MHIFSKDQQAFHLQRTKAEKWFTRINTLLVAVQLACFLCALIRTSMNASNSMQNSLFSSSVLSLRPAFVVPGCEYQVVRSHAFFRNVTFTMGPENVGYFVSRGVLNIRYLMAVAGVHMVISAVNRVWFETNTHEIRYHFVVFRKDMVTTWEILLMVMGIVLTIGITQENTIMQNYLEACNDNVSNSYYCSALPFIELYISFFISLGVTAINLLVALWNLSKPNPRDKLMKEEQARRDEMRALAERYQQELAGDGAGNVHGDYSGAGGGQPQTTDPQAAGAAAGRTGATNDDDAAAAAARQDAKDDPNDNEGFDEELDYDGYNNHNDAYDPDYDAENGAYNDDYYQEEEAAYDEEDALNPDEEDDYGADYDEALDEPIAEESPLDGDFADEGLAEDDNRAAAAAGSSSVATPLGLSSMPPPALTSFEVVPSSGNSRFAHAARHFPPPSAADDGSHSERAGPPPARPERGNKMLAPPTPLEGLSGESTDLA